MPVDNNDFDWLDATIKAVGNLDEIHPKETLVMMTKEDADRTITEFYKALTIHHVKHIQHNPDKGATAVTFENGDVVIVRRAESQEDDLYFAVASAIAEEVYGSNNAFKKMINEKTEVIHKKKKIGDSLKGVTDSVERWSDYRV